MLSALRSIRMGQSSNTGPYNQADLDCPVLASGPYLPRPAGHGAIGTLRRRTPRQGCTIARRDSAFGDPCASEGVPRLRASGRPGHSVRRLERARRIRAFSPERRTRSPCSPIKTAVRRHTSSSNRCRADARAASPNSASSQSATLAGFSGPPSLSSIRASVTPASSGDPIPAPAFSILALASRAFPTASRW